MNSCSYSPCEPARMSQTGIVSPSFP
jgi:hypothetical protein